MKKANVEIGKTYVAKISNQLTTVKLLSECPYGGWYAVNLQTNRRIRIKTAAKLRRESKTAIDHLL